MKTMKMKISSDKEDDLTPKKEDNLTHLTKNMKMKSPKMKTTSPNNLKITKQNGTRGNVGISGIYRA